MAKHDHNKIEPIEIITNQLRGSDPSEALRLHQS
jgi:hypothetical protein